MNQRMPGEAGKGLPSKPAPARKEPRQQATPAPQPAPATHTAPAVHAQPTIPELRAKQKGGGLPPPCRGAECSADQLLDSLSTRFRILYRRLQGSEQLSGKGIIILLTNNDPAAIAQVNWLLEQHADFSGKNGQVVMNERARQWLGHRRGAVQLDESDARHHAELMAMIDGGVQRLAELVQRAGLGAPPQFKGASLKSMQMQFESWMARAGKDLDVLGALTQHGVNLRELHVMAARHALPKAIARVADTQGLSVTIVAGPDAAALDWANGDLDFPGLILTPAELGKHKSLESGQWEVQALNAALNKEFGIDMKLMDLEGQPLAGRRSLNGVFMLAGVAAGQDDASSKLASGLLAALRQSPTGPVPVTLLQSHESVAVNQVGQTMQVLPEPMLQDITDQTRKLTQDLDRLLNFVNKHTAQEPIERESRNAFDTPYFSAQVKERANALPAPQRTQALKQLAEYEAGQKRLSELHLSRWRAHFTEAFRIFGQSSEAAHGVHVLTLPAQTLSTLSVMLADSDELAGRFREQVVVALVAGAIPSEPLAPPLPHWTAGELSTRLASQHMIETELLDMKRRPIAPTRSLNGVLLVAGVKGDAFESVELASRMVGALRQSPSGAVPVQILQIPESLALYGNEHTRHVLPDPRFAQHSETVGGFNVAFDALMSFLATHSVKEPLDSAAVENMGHKKFVIHVRALVEGMGEARALGLGLLSEYEKRYAGVSQCYVDRWRSLFTEALAVLKASGQGQGMHLLALPLETAQNALAILRETPELAAQFGLSIVLTRVSTTAGVQMPVVPKVELM